MNDPSPEAKQAWEADNKGIATTTQFALGWCEGYDTATAKAREELEQLKSTRDELALRPPTADVEKIARKVGLELIGKSGSEVEAILARYFAQAHAPLVEAGKQAIPRLERCMCAGSDGHKLNLKIAKHLAALTGTGEK